MVEEKQKVSENSRKGGICIDCGKRNSRPENPRCRSCYFISKRRGLSIQEYKRDWLLKRKYNIDLEEFEFYWFACRGRCWICNSIMSRPRQTRGQLLDIVSVDHNHKTGKFRGLLCGACNKGIGLLKDDVVILRKAIEYLCVES